MYGGGQRVVADLSQETKRQGGESEILLLGAKTTRFNHMEPVIIPYDGRYNRFSSLLRTAVSVRDNLVKNSTALLHTHGWDADIIGYLARWRLNLPLIIHLHVMPKWLMSRSPKHIARRALTRRAFEAGGVRVVAVSGAVRRHWESGLPFTKGKIRVIHNGIDTRMYRPVELDGHRVSNSPIIGVASRLVETKGIAYLLDSLRTLLRERVPFSLHVAGEGPDQPELEKRAKDLQIQDHVNFLGQLENMPEFFNGIDVFVCPSFTEGMPITILEAMAAGKPVVASRVGGIPEAVRDRIDGFLVSPGDTSALTDVLRRVLLDGALRERLGGSALKRAQEHFSIERFYGEITDLYKEMLSKSAGTAA